MSLKETDKAYIAGFMDGEGSIGINRDLRRRASTERVYYKLNVQATNTDPSALDLIYENYGGSRFSVQDRKSISQRWCITSHSAGKFLEDILPYLRQKKVQAEIALEFLRECNIGKHGSTRLTQAENDLREQYARRIEACPGRGRQGIPQRWKTK